MTEQAQEIIDNEEKEDQFETPELNQKDVDLVGVDKMEFPEMNFEMNLE